MLVTRFSQLVEGNLLFVTTQDRRNQIIFSFHRSCGGIYIKIFIVVFLLICNIQI